LSMRMSLSIERNLSAEIVPRYGRNRYTRAAIGD
jgi:hypothetical protein